MENERNQSPYELESKGGEAYDHLILYCRSIELRM